MTHIAHAQVLEVHKVNDPHLNVGREVRGRPGVRPVNLPYPGPAVNEQIPEMIGIKVSNPSNR